MSQRRTTLLLVIGVLLSATLCTYGAWHLQSAHHAALAAEDELIECSRLARTLALLKSGPVGREALSTLLPEASAAVADAAARSGVPAGVVQVGQAFPGPGAEVGLPVRVQGGTLEQLVAFVYRLSSEPDVMQVQSLVLAGSANDQARWDLDLTLSCNVAGDAGTEGR